MPFMSRMPTQARTYFINASEAPRVARRDDQEYRVYLREEQRRQRGCIASRMPLAFMR